MAIITGTISKVKAWSDTWIASWLAIGNADTGTGIELTGMADRSIQVSGTWASATVVVQGSNDNVTWVTLVDPQGNAISKTADFIEQILEYTRYIRVSSSGGAGTNLNATLFGSGTMQ